MKDLAPNSLRARLTALARFGCLNRFGRILFRVCYALSSPSRKAEIRDWLAA